jgi:hypothetical protein
MMDKPHTSLALYAVLGFVAIIHGAWWLVGSPPPELLGFSDGDSYLRLLRVERLLETGDWFDITIADVNAPYGATLHWTRLFDVVLIGMALPLMPILGSAKALFWAGMVVSPIIHVVSAGILVWALEPLLGRKGACIAGALSAAQAGVLAFSTFGHADHHMMFVLLSALAVGLVSRLILSDDNTGQNGLALGAVLAAGVWVGPEYMVFTILSFAVTGLYWIAGGANAAPINKGMAVGLFWTLLIAIVVESGISDVGRVAYDHVSIVHLAFGGCLTVFWRTISIMDGRLATVRGRVFAAVISAMAFSGLMITLFPQIIANPLNDADPAILPIYAMISEYRAIADPARFLIYFGSALFVVPWALWRLRQVWGMPTFWVWLLLIASLVIYMGYAVLWLRWSLYAGLFLGVILADLASALDDRISERFDFPIRVLIKVGALLVLIVGPLVGGAILLQAMKTPAERAAAHMPDCSATALSAHLATMTVPVTIVASANFGAEIVYRTDHQVLATVHHRNAAGILDGYRILGGTDDRAIQAIMAKRKADTIVLCPGSSNDAYFLLEGDEDTLYRRLIGGEAPVYLSAIPLPDDLAQGFRLYQLSGSIQ